jgi:hypothetical protein
MNTLPVLRHRELHIKDMDLLIQPSPVYARLYAEQQMREAGFTSDRPVHVAVDHCRRTVVFMQERS